MIQTKLFLCKERETESRINKTLAELQSANCKIVEVKVNPLAIYPTAAMACDPKFPKYHECTTNYEFYDRVVIVYEPVNDHIVKQHQLHTTFLSDKDLDLLNVQLDKFIDRMSDKDNFEVVDINLDTEIVSDDSGTIKNYVAIIKYKE